MKVLSTRLAAPFVAALCFATPFGARAADAALLTQNGPETAPNGGGIRSPASNVGPESPSGVSTNPNNNTSGAGTSSQGSLDIPLPISAPPRTGLFPQVGQSLLDRGIDLHGIAFDHFLANPSAGVKTGELNNLAVVAPAVDIDLQRLLGFPNGGSLHAQMTFFGLKDDVPSIALKTGGVLTGFQTTPAPVSQVLSVLTYEQHFLNDKLSFEAGRTNPYRSFFLPNSLDIFSYFSPTIQVVGDLNSNPYPVWGGRATYHITPTWYVQGGAFEDNYRRAVTNGDNFGIKENSGYTVIGELAYRSEFNNAAYPANLEAGFLFNERVGGRTNLKGTLAPSNPVTDPRNYGSGGVIFLQGLKVLYRGERGAYGPPKNISVYGSINQSVDQPQPFLFDALAGLNFTGFIPGRPLDALGLQARVARLSQVEAAAETALVRAALGKGSTATQARNGFAFEAIGSIALTQSIVLRPYAEYFVNPDTYYLRTPHKPAQDGFEAGIFATIALGRLLGTSEKPF